MIRMSRLAFDDLQNSIDELFISIHNYLVYNYHCQRIDEIQRFVKSDMRLYCQKIRDNYKVLQYDTVKSLSDFLYQIAHALRTRAFSDNTFNRNNPIADVILCLIWEAKNFCEVVDNKNDVQIKILKCEIFLCLNDYFSFFGYSGSAHNILDQALALLKNSINEKDESVFKTYYKCCHNQSLNLHRMKRHQEAITLTTESLQYARIIFESNNEDVRYLVYALGNVNVFYRSIGDSVNADRFLREMESLKPQAEIAFQNNSLENL
jgi:hypothetical protein